MSLPAWSKALSQNVNMAKTHLALDITQLFCPAGVNQHKHIHETLFSFFFFFIPTSGFGCGHQISLLLPADLHLVHFFQQL